MYPKFHVCKTHFKIWNTIYLQTIEFHEMPAKTVKDQIFLKVDISQNTKIGLIKWNMLFKMIFMIAVKNLTFSMQISHNVYIHISQVKIRQKCIQLKNNVFSKQNTVH